MCVGYLDVAHGRVIGFVRVLTCCRVFVMVVLVRKHILEHVAVTLAEKRHNAGAYYGSRVRAA